ncbi:MAG: hypothetical protein KKB57_01500 [Proteobacteria bacterium]|nr:hypothetical protein [Pseudomonadota bacterium]
MKDEPVSTLGVRIPKSLHKRLKLFCVEYDLEIQKFVAEAIEDKLNKLEQKHDKPAQN